VPAPQPRRLTAAEAAAIKARPWPRLPWWLWLVAAATTVATVAVAVALVSGNHPAAPLGAGRSAPGGRFSHDVGEARIPALDQANRAVVTRRHPGCPRLAGLTLAGTPGELDLLAAAADRVCGLRSTAPVERAREALDRDRVTVAFAEFRASGNESTTRFARDGASVLVNGKFSRGPAERVAVLLVHEGSHVADGGPPDAAGELAAVRAQADACQRLFTGQEQLGPNRSCLDGDALLAAGEARALAALRAAGYR
jgi:hypothetical protein